MATKSGALPREVDAPMILGHALTRILRLGRQALAKAESSDTEVKRKLPQPTVHVAQQTPRRRPPQAHAVLGMASVPSQKPHGADVDQTPLPVSAPLATRVTILSDQTIGRSSTSVVWFKDCLGLLLVACRQP